MLDFELTLRLCGLLMIDLGFSFSICNKVIIFYRKVSGLGLVFEDFECLLSVLAELCQYLPPCDERSFIITLESIYQDDDFIEKLRFLITRHGTEFDLPGGS
jgi:hypothetical protein